MLKWVALLLACALAVAAWTRGSLWQLPERFDPWATLQIDAAPNWLTRYKLSRLQREPALCLAVLAQAGFDFETVADRETAPGCGFTNAVRISRTTFQLSAPFALSCPAAVSLALWERHSVLPTAERVLRSPVRRMNHFGSYACRNVYGREGGRRSEHAGANALDVAGFVLGDGRNVTVARDWDSGGDRAMFLRMLHSEACDYFGGVFGPDYNAAHADHFHLDRGRYHVCR